MFKNYSIKSDKNIKNTNFSGNFTNYHHNLFASNSNGTSNIFNENLQIENKNNPVKDSIGNNSTDFYENKLNNSCHPDKINNFLNKFYNLDFLQNIPFDKESFIHNNINNKNDQNFYNSNCININNLDKNSINNINDKKINIIENIFTNNNLENITNYLNLENNFNFQINSREPYNFSTDNINLSKNLFSSKLNNHNNLNFTNFINNNINYSNNGKNSIFVDNNECNIKLIQTNKNNNNEL